jgi:hypothetical protein
MDTLRIDAIRYKNIDWLCLGKTPGGAAQDGRPKKEKSGFPRLSLIVNHWLTIQIEMIPAGHSISAETHVLDLDQGHDTHGVITVIHVVGSGLFANFLDGNDSTLHNKSPSRIGWPTSYLCIHYTKDSGKCKMAK